MLGRMGVLAGAGLVGPTILAACGGDDDSGSGGGDGGDSNALWHENWTGYMDEETVGLFKEETGIDLKYTEQFDNYESFAKYQADLADEAQHRARHHHARPTGWRLGSSASAGWPSCPSRTSPTPRTSCPTCRTRTSTRTASTPCPTSRA